MSDSPRSVPDWVVRLIADAKAADGAPPFSDQSLVDYRTGARELISIDESAAALVAPSEAEFVVAPRARRHDLGTQLLGQLLADGSTLFWAHGDAPGARALAASHGLTAVRELLHFAGEVSITPGFTTATRPEGVGMFVVGQDEDEWLALNARTFAHHPEQGSVTRADLEQLETEPWFRADNFFVLRRDGRIIGYCWLKVEDDRGEFYVVGVDPDHHGEKLGSLLFDAGLARLRELGIRTAHLYVEGDNVEALRLYRSRGFTQDSIDIQYQASTGSTRGY
jgi:mycothiol synthase